MLRSLPLLPTLLGLNFWLIALLVPLLLGRAAASSLVWAVAPLGPLALLCGLGLRRYRLAQLTLLVGVPLLVLMPTAEGALASAKLHPPAAVAVQLVVLVGYLAAVCAELARGPVPAFASPGAPSATALSSLGSEQAPGWQLLPPVAVQVSPRLRRRIAVYRLLLAMGAVVPLLFLYAINWDPGNIRALRAAFGPEARVSAMQATLTAGAAMIWSVLFHFYLMAPMDAHLDHDRKLRSRLSALRAGARRARPRLNLYLAIGVALLSMGLLIWWSL